MKKTSQKNAKTLKNTERKPSRLRLPRLTEEQLEVAAGGVIYTDSV